MECWNLESLKSWKLEILNLEIFQDFKISRFQDLLEILKSWILKSVGGECRVLSARSQRRACGGSRVLRARSAWNLEILKSLNLAILKSWNPEILKSWNLEILKSWDPESLKSWNLETLKSWNPEIWNSWKLEILKSWNLEILKSWNLEILKS